MTGCATGTGSASSCCFAGCGRPNKSGGITRRRWLGSLIFEHAHQQQAFQTYLHALDLVDRRIEQLERELDAAARDGPWRELVAWCGACGVDTLTALGLVAEIGTDWSRFRTAEQFMSLAGLLVPSERSSGQQRSRGSITKAGNGHVRRLLVEAARHQRQRPRVCVERQPLRAIAASCRGDAIVSLLRRRSLASGHGSI